MHTSGGKPDTHALALDVGYTKISDQGQGVYGRSLEQYQVPSLSPARPPQEYGRAEICQERQGPGVHLQDLRK